MEKAKIILVEDNQKIQKELCEFLSRYDYETKALNNFENIVEDILKERADLVLLDINLPVYDGYYICRAVREKSDVPIIVVTSRDSEMDELMSMNLGADDFISKPYNTQILVARISSLLKRTKHVKEDWQMTHKGLLINLSNSTACHGKEQIELSKNEVKILSVLVKHKEKIVSRDNLMEELWQSNEFVDDNTLTVNINRLRKKTGFHWACRLYCHKERAGVSCMSFRAYLRDKSLFFGLQIFYLAFLVWMLNLFHATTFAIIYLLCLYFILMILALGNEYFKRKRFYETALESMDSLDKKFMLPELLDRPDFTEGKIFYDCLSQTNKSMSDEVAVYKISAQDYREYVEMWIHEVKTPIAASRLMIENNPSEVTKNISEELEEVEYYLEQALYYSRSNGVEKDYIVKRMNLNSMVQELIRSNSKILIQSKVKVSLENLDYDVYTDEKWMSFILKQVLINAVKYRKDHPEIRFTAADEKEQVQLYIEDNGIGISGKDLPRVMEKGYTGTTGRKYAKSTGMGLYLCRKLSDKLGIGFAVRSKEGEGTQIKITFPKNSFVYM